ncbi:hypothetical protein EHI42_20700 [Rhizobium hidalgonense]|uniref:hypothetical protein n=1 Tax=Rhizobium hidalgonense TaxID=1538159 RepID=UPI000FEC8096|nr:hypothetical protein [Rhizobium hidalgonense]RWX13456.1 hypothetical protein EHI42_20700 [Rhizobium hidalgonense]
MFVVSIYANGRPECFSARAEECVDVIVDMTGIPASQAHEYLAKAMLVNRLRVVGPFELAIDYGDVDSEPLVLPHEDAFNIATIPLRQATRRTIFEGPASSVATLLARTTSRLLSGAIRL